MSTGPLRRAVEGAAALARAGLRPERPDRLPRALLAGAWWGPTLAGAVAAATARYPTAPAVIDDDGSLSYARLWARTDGQAAGLRRRGIGPGTTVGILAGNGRGFVEAMVAASKLGADIVYLNTGFAPPQLADVVGSEGVDVILHDDGFRDVVSAAPVATVSGTDLDRLASTRHAPLTPRRTQGRTVILTSGTTGRPKGAQRSTAGGPEALTALVGTVPVRARDTVVVAAPLFHAWGLSHLGLGLALSSTIVLRRSSRPDAVLDAVERHRADGLVVVPVMLQRMLRLDDDELRRFDTASLRYIASSGSALGAGLATAVLDRFGPVLYNVYGSTEVSLAAIAGPQELRVAPATAGRPAAGATVRILDEHGRPVPDGTVGRIFVGSSGRFDGYTGGGTKESVDGLLSSGDVGRLEDGLLFVEGRDDDMIVSGGENVFPAEVEELLAAHPEVAEAAVVGVDDEEFGQRLRAVVALRPGADVGEDELRDHVRSRLARHKVPREVVFVDELPRTTTGKVLRREL